jgi:hypothetical protein
MLLAKKLMLKYFFAFSFRNFYDLMRSKSIVRAFSMLVIWNGSVHGGSDRSKGVVNTRPRYLIPPLVYPVVRVCPIVYFVFYVGLNWLITVLYSTYCIRLITSGRLATNILILMI